jgi:hypothetical protein
LNWSFITFVPKNFTFVKIIKKMDLQLWNIERGVDGQRIFILILVRYSIENINKYTGVMYRQIYLVYHLIAVWIKLIQFDFLIYQCHVLKPWCSTRQITCVWVTHSQKTLCTIDIHLLKKVRGAKIDKWRFWDDTYLRYC